MAIAAHPDDIEFMMAGTLLLLKQAGWTIHMWNLANGHCGSATLDTDEIVRKRWEEAEQSAKIAGAILHLPLVQDLAITYDPLLLARVTGVIRQVKPNILFVPSLQDYMEDHSTTARLAVTAAFARGMRNFQTDPAALAWEGECMIYHALPFGLRDGMRKRIYPELYVNVAQVHQKKIAMLEQHSSQKDWLDVSQGTGSYIAQMVAQDREVGGLSGAFPLAEGWRRHSHLGFSAEDVDPLREILGGGCRYNEAYAATLDESL